MLSATLARQMGTRQIHYGWAVLAATFFTMLVVAGAVGAPGVFIIPLQKEFGWSSADISGALAIRFLLFGGMGPFAAAFMNRFGVRRMMLISLSIIVGGLLLSMGMTRLWHLVLLWGVVIGIGTGLTAMVLGATVATRWFAHRRGLVMGLLSASTATGQLAFLPLLAALTERFGWRASVLLVCGAILLAAMVVLLLMRDRPADLGLPPYGESEVHPAPPQPASFGALLMSPLRILADAARVPSFWILFFSFYICGASTNGLVQTHFIALCGDYGLAAVGAASMLAMMGLFDFAGTLASGWLSDRFDNRWLLFWYYGLRGLSLLYLPFSDFSFYSLSVFAMFYGLDWVATVPPTVKLTAQRFGPERANVVFGWIFAGHQLGAASAALAGGLSRTVWQSYMPAFVAAGILCLIGAGLVLLINRGRSKTFVLA
ncbi:MULTISPECIES: MFS transporter [Sphingobium]|jgi:MFS family permease|uniref:MFS permease n=1 Tax=Sphingobium fuliginis (strain ATCC 27551) TaxID=336203 RepID=A0A292ZLV6_SPHSA|nr:MULTISPECIES: MFS transporter [Sphingobium]PNP97282.1 MFS transporter [Sphingobium sp. SA916]QOT73679.1 MFS transporter [Sphingobium fuliginis]UXC93084.1 MFS transporter [Sphingobium sp. RSMS]GAY23815.1 MFS permease [Sphingobium fuliginis]